jgi:hypothetical protein
MEPPAPLRATCTLPIDLCHHGLQIPSLRKIMPVRTVCSPDIIILLQRKADSGSDGLLSDIKSGKECSELGRLRSWLGFGIVDGSLTLPAQFRDRERVAYAPGSVSGIVRHLCTLAVENIFDSRA